MTKWKEDCLNCESRETNPLCSVDSGLSAIMDARITGDYKAGQTIFYQGGTPLGMYTVQNGLVRLETHSDDGVAHTLRLMGPGHVLGYRALFSGDKYRASAVAVENSTLCFIPHAVITSVIAKNPAVAFNMLARLSRDLRLAEEKWITQIDRDAPERVAEALLFLSDHFGDQPWTRREIAEWAGTTPETVMRVLSQFEKSGLVFTEARRIKILNRPKLSEKSKGA